MRVEIRPIALDEPGFPALLAEAEAGDGPFLRRLADEWGSGLLLFDGPGEFLLGGFCANELVAIGGVSRDPYDPQPWLGRVRHVYVLQRRRGQGVGRSLMGHIMARARADWRVLRLRTRDAGAFYEKLGFVPSTNANETHRLDL